VIIVENEQDKLAIRWSGKQLNGFERMLGI
jgi:hypothetical protein